MRYSTLCDLVKNDTRKCLRVFFDSMGDMPADSLTFAILIGRDIDGVCFFCKFSDLFDRRGVLFGYGIFRSQYVVIIDLDPETGFWQIARNSKPCAMVA